MAPIAYLRGLRPARVVLWCYLIWYLVSVALNFDPSPAIWLNSLGLSAVIGTALLLSVSGAGRADRWQVLRLFLMPFCVSSFSSLIKGRGYLLIFPPRPAELLLSVGACLGFVLLVAALKRLGPATAG